MEDNVSKDAMALFVQLRRLRLDLVSWVNRRLAQHGINLPQYTLMEKLDETGEATMGTLSDKLGVTMGAATNLVDRLLYAGHVERKRSDTDRRVVKVKLTDSGRKVLYHVTDETAAFLAQSLQQVQPADRGTMISVTAQVADFVSRHMDDAQ